MSQLEQLWKDYRSTGSRQAKDKILAEYASLARYTAQRLAINLPPEVELGDLIGAGVFGLIKAVESFDPDREVRFETFATWKHAIRRRGRRASGARPAGIRIPAFRNRSDHHRLHGRAAWPRRRRPSRLNL